LVEIAASKETTNELTVSETGIIYNRPVINRSRWGGAYFLDQSLLVEGLGTEQIHSVLTFVKTQGNKSS